jgi:hypothetical protein
LPLGFSVLGRNRKENYELFILDSGTNSSACSIFIYGAMGVSFKRQASSCKRQASSNTNQVISLPQLDGKLQAKQKGKK